MYTNYCDIPHKQHPYRMRANLDPKWQRNVCTCWNPGGLQSKEKYGDMCVCKLCGKPPVYWIHKCTYCGDEFLHDFEQNFCSKEPLCFKCNSMNAYCTGHTYCITWIPDDKQVPPSVELLPPYTEADLADVFDFE